MKLKLYNKIYIKGKTSKYPKNSKIKFWNELSENDILIISMNMTRRFGHYRCFIWNTTKNIHMYVLNGELGFRLGKTDYIEVPIVDNDIFACKHVEDTLYI